MHSLSTRLRGSIIAWIIGSVIATLIAWQWADIVFVAGDYIPVGADAFYHTRRILDTVAHPSAFYEFDTRIHAPEGSWLTWPWGFDRLMALLTSLGMIVDSGADAGHVLMVIPVVWLLINVALMVALCSELKLSLPVKILAIICYALLPFTQAMHSVGVIDHHFAEHTFFLLSVLLSLKWFANPDSRLFPTTLGLTLGIAPAFHNGLFILQLPLLFCLIILWLRISTLRIKNQSWFTIPLVLGTVIAVLPSASFRHGEFSFYLLSWLHLYIACCTALIVEFIMRVRFSVRNFMVFAATLFFLSAILSRQILHGAHFITGDIEQYSTIIETQSIFTQMKREGVLGVVKLYTMLIALLPVALIWQLDEARSALRRYTDEPADAGSRMVFAAYVCFGGILLLFQMRFQYFGTVAMILPLMLIIDEWLVKSTSGSMGKWLVIVIGIGVAYMPSMLNLAGQRAVGMDVVYNNTRQIFTTMAKHCKEDPGVVLAKWTSGNHIRFHTDCSVIANNMILTQQHVEKVQLSERLLRENADTLRDSEPWIKYLFLVREDNPTAGLSDEEVREQNTGLRYELLVSGRPLPKGYILLGEVRTELPVNAASGRFKVIPIARFFRIEH